jgi:hypothetical protein
MNYQVYTSEFGELQMALAGTALYLPLLANLQHGFIRHLWLNLCSKICGF